MAAGGSILSFPERGSWGDPGYRGNCSGYVYREIFERLHPRVFTDSMVEPSRQRFEKALKIYRAIGNRLGEANCLESLGEVHRALKRE
jgi:hypothetical protein